MTLQARIIGPESELGHVSSVTYFGNTLTREFSDVELNAAQVRKAEGNKFIELKGNDRALTHAEQQQAADDQAEAELIRERLAELKVTVAETASLKTLRSKLEAAEKTEAKRLEAEAEAQAKAQAEAEATAQA